MTSKKDYEAVAKAIKMTTTKSTMYCDKKDLIMELIYYFRSDNPLFDTEQFKKACIGDIK
jgi:hypothetical protein